MGIVNGVNGDGRGRLVGQQLGGSPYINYSYATTKQTWGLIGYKKNGGSTGCAEVSDDEMKGWDTATITEKLTDNFKKAENNINDGYPILSWE